MVICECLTASSHFLIRKLRLRGRMWPFMQTLCCIHDSEELCGVSQAVHTCVHSLAVNISGASLFFLPGPSLGDTLFAIHNCVNIGSWVQHCTSTEGNVLILKRAGFNILGRARK